MRKFSNIEDALDFAAQNKSRLRFPFSCKCNGFSVRVLSPAMARTIDRDRPMLVVRRKPSNALELGYVISLPTLKLLLRDLSGREQNYTLMPGTEDVIVLCRAAGGATSKFSFPLAHRVPELLPSEGDYVLVLERPQTGDWHRFWTPLETRLLHSSIAATA